MGYFATNFIQHRLFTQCLRNTIDSSEITGTSIYRGGQDKAGILAHSTGYVARNTVIKRAFHMLLVIQLGGFTNTIRINRDHIAIQ